MAVVHVWFTFSAGHVYAGLKRLELNLGNASKATGRNLAQTYVKNAKKIIKKNIPSNRRSSGGLADSFIIEESKGKGRSGPNYRFYVTNSKYYAPFIDQADISKSSVGTNKPSHAKIKGDTKLSDWFLSKANWGTQYDRLPYGASIGLGHSGKFSKYSLFAKYPNGLQFTRTAFNIAVKDARNNFKKELDKAIKKL